MDEPIVEHVCVNLYVKTDGGVMVFLSSLTSSSSRATCNYRHIRNGSRLWMSKNDGNDIRCFSCVPWGNFRVAQDFQETSRVIWSR
jgi:hypothetical protein